MNIIDYLRAMGQQGGGQPGAFMPPPDPSLYADQSQTVPDPTMATGGMSQDMTAAPPSPLMQRLQQISASQTSIPGAMAPVQAPQDQPMGFLDRIKSAFHDPAAAQTLLSIGANLLQSGGPNSKPVSLGQALGGAVNAGMGAYQGAQAQQEADAARKQQMAASQWTTLNPQQVKDAKLQELPPGYVWQRNGNGEVKPVGENPIKEGTDQSTGLPTLLDTRKPIPNGAGTAAASGVIPGPYDPQTLDTAATTVMSDPNRIRDYASFGKMGMAARMQIQKAMSQKLLAAGMTNNDLVALRARATAEKGNVATLTKQQAQVNAADQLVHANGDRLMQLFDLVDDTGVPMAEGITRSAKAKMGNVDAAELSSVLTTFQTEVAKMLGGNPNMSGVISDNMRQEIMKMSPANMSTAQAKRIINRLYLETSIRQQAINDQLNQGVNQSVVGGQPSTQTSATNGSPQSMSNADLLKALGAGPNG